jgi:hypothetical protein
MKQMGGRLESFRIYVDHPARISGGARADNDRQGKPPALTMDLYTQGKDKADFGH